MLAAGDAFQQITLRKAGLGKCDVRRSHTVPNVFDERVLIAMTHSTEKNGDETRKFEVKLRVRFSRRDSSRSERKTRLKKSRAVGKRHC